MKPRHRSLLGIAFAVILVPVLVGLAACLPVPIGDPERSRIDPDMTGIWTNLESEPSVTLFEPYDKRTWLVTSVGTDAAESCALADKPADYEELITWLEEEQCASADQATIYKAWRSKHGKHWFLTMEPMAILDEDKDNPFDEGVWFVYAIKKASADAFELKLIDPEFEDFKRLPEKRRAYEKIIRRHASNEDMYLDDVTHLIRVRKEHIDLFADVVSDVIDVDL